MKTFCSVQLLFLLLLTTSTVSGQSTQLVRPPRPMEKSLSAQFPERPFLLVDAPRRFLPTEQSRVRIQLRSQQGGERVEVTLFRIHRPAVALGLVGRRQGIALAQTTLGAEAEQLVARTDAIPRPGSQLTLILYKTVVMPLPEDLRVVHDEAEVSDSFEEEENDVATSWMQASGWSSTTESLGRLSPGTYLVRVHFGSWATSAVLSVGNLVMVARRGDQRDRVLITDQDGRPQPGVIVTSSIDGRHPRRATTGSNGEALFSATDAPVVRFVARRGNDVVWSDGVHVRLDSCDPLLYLATGRPTYRSGETIYLRGHLRGCDEDGRFVGLGGERIRLVSARTEDQTEEVVTDEDGNFTARLRAGFGEIVAEVRGHEHRRDVRIDHRQLPQRPVQITTDRPWAATGDVVAVQVSDADGGWPRVCDAILQTPQGQVTARVGPNMPAVFHLTIASTASGAERFPLAASVVDRNRVTMAAAEIWVGRSPTLLELESEAEQGRSGEAFPVTVRATNLAGEPVAGPVTLILNSSNEGHQILAELWRHEIRFSAGQNRRTPDAQRVRVPLSGRGPWLLQARRGQISSELVIWERARPPSLSQRGILALLPTAETVHPGRSLFVDVRAPVGLGRLWLTLEQGDVWSSRLLTPPSGGMKARTFRTSLPIPTEAHGLAKVVATHIAKGVVRIANTTVEVATSAEVSLEVTTNKRSYAAGEKARTVIEARDVAGRPRDGVISLWLADAGYWEMGEDEYPRPGEFLRPPGRMASAADSTRPPGYGAEEGRVLPDATLQWNGRVVPRSTYRHGWGSPGKLVAVRSSGRLQQVLTHFGLAAGFTRVEVCEDVARTTGHVDLLARNLPWDLVTQRIAQETNTSARVESDVLHFECGGYVRGSGGLRGRRASVPYLRTGMALAGQIREAQLEGTQHFIGLRRLGPDGRLELDLDLPEIPGRWRVEVLTIADDGGGARAHHILHTTKPLRAWLDLPQRLAVGDSASGFLRVWAPSRAGRSISLELDLREGSLALERPIPSTTTLDGSGGLELPVTLRALSSEPAQIVLSAESGPIRDDIRTTVDISDPLSEQPLRLRALIGESPWDVHLELPPLAQSATLTISLDSGLRRAVDDVFESTQTPRWDTALMRIDRLATLSTLRQVVTALPQDAQVRITAWHVQRAYDGEAAALVRHQSAAGGFAWWWRLPGSARVTAEALAALGQSANEDQWQSAWDALRRRAEEAVDGGEELDGATLCLAARLFARDNSPEDSELARALLERGLRSINEGDLDALSSAFRAARDLGDRSQAQALVTPMTTAIRAELSSPPRQSCSGPSWFLCYRRWGRRGAIARAVSTLIESRVPGSQALASEVTRWLSEQPAMEGHWSWGTDEADLLRLFAHVMTPGDHRDRPLASVDGHPLSIRNGTLRLPRDAQRLTLRFPARSGRLSYLRIDGRLVVVPPHSPQGTLGLSRRFVRTDDQWNLEVELCAPRTLEEVELIVPLPAGLGLVSSVEERAGVDLSMTNGEVGLRWERLPLGSTTVRLSLAALGSGTYHAGPARVRDGEGSIWGITPVTTVTIE